MSFLRTLFILLLVFASLPSYAVVQRHAIAGVKPVTLYWWPKVTAPEGWKHDTKSSIQYAADAYTLAGKSFEESEIFMYAKAVFRPQETGLTSLQDYIKRDQAAILSTSPGMKIIIHDSLKTGDGTVLVTYDFIPNKNGDWKRISYGTEGDYYLAFAITSHTEAGLHAFENDYRKLITSYKK